MRRLEETPGEETPDELLEEIAQNSKTSKELRQAYAFHFQILSTFKGQDASVGGKWASLKTRFKQT